MDSPRRIACALIVLLSLILLSGCGVPIEPGMEGTLTPQAEAVATATAAVPGADNPNITINAVGDLMLERDIITLMDRYGSVYPFEAVKAVLEDADITIANMEGTFTEGGVQQNKYYTFRTPPRHAKGLRQAGIDVVALGNNHAMDYGDQGLADTLTALDAAGVRHSGAGEDAASARAPAVLEVKGRRIAFLSYNAVLEATFADESSPGVARASEAAIRDDVKNSLQIADIVVVSVHAGTEYQDAPTAEQESLLKAVMDAGASLALGHHAHVFQGWVEYGNGVIVYGLGNFVFDLDYDDLETLGARPFQTAIMHFELTPDGTVVAVGATPVFIDPGENRPLLAAGEQLAAIEERFRQLHAGFR